MEDRIKKLGDKIDRENTIITKNNFNNVGWNWTVNKEVKLSWKGR